MLAPHYSKLDLAKEMLVSPPYVPANLPTGIRCRGAIRSKTYGYEFHFTGPTLKVVFSGCRWNTVVFAMDESQAAFQDWLQKIWARFQEIVRSDPAKYKVTNRRGPQFPTFLVTPSSDPEVYPPELRCRLATQRRGTEVVETTCTAVLECQGEKIDPSTVWAGSLMTPIFKLVYYKNGDDFGLQLVVCKAEYQMPTRQAEIQYDQMIIDTENACGSPTSSEVEVGSDSEGGGSV
jgi:hypothetical protein